MTMQAMPYASGTAIPMPDLFDLEQSFNCGQCFRWTKQENGVFSGIAFGKYCAVSEDLDRGLLVFHNVSPEELETVWAPYFDLDTDYGAIRRELCRLDPVMAEAAAFAPGIRILRQEPWETLCSFIISQNNNIPRIRGIIDRLCQQFGRPLPRGGFAFPTPERMAGLTAEDLAPLRCGFRAKYLCSAAQLVTKGAVPLERIAAMPLEEARQTLMRIQGVGPKVAECVLLYGFHRMECFPMDVWMKRVMGRLFPGKDSAFFGAQAGVAQQYLFYYSRQNPRILE